MSKQIKTKTFPGKAKEEKKASPEKERLAKKVGSGKRTPAKKKEDAAAAPPRRGRRRAAAKKPQIIRGTLSKHKKGFGFVLPEDGQGSDVYVASADINGAMDGDLVEAVLAPSGRGGRRRPAGGDSREGYIDRIVSRGVTEVVGTFERDRKIGFVVPDNKRMREEIFVRQRDFQGARRGDKVVVRITNYPDREKSAEGRITEIVSRSGEVGGDIKSLIRSYGLSQGFPAPVEETAAAVAAAGLAADGDGFAAAVTAGRADLRDKTVVTIDGADSKDFDDAVSALRLKNGNYLLGVHIADVTHYVADGDPLDTEALNRGTSVYLVDQVIPMLPKALSNGICSLNPGVDRLTLSVDMEINPDGEVVKHRIYESVIRSKARLVYTDVSDMLENKDAALIDQYRAIYDDLLLMDELAKLLRRKREQRGSLDFDFDEAHISLNAEGVPVSVTVAERRTANKLIEEFMLLANETVAAHFFVAELPFVYRVHEKPSLEKMEELAVFLQSIGILLPGDPAKVSPKTLSHILSQAAGKPYENVVGTVMLRSMQKAYYDPQCLGHFGLALKYYCHFTSPIRRYPDLFVHRMVKLTLKGPLSEQRRKSCKRKAEEAAERSSATERQALELEREVEKLKKAEYMSYHLGEVHEGIISGVTGYGIYVALPNTIEGMVRVDTLDDDYYDYESDKYRLIGRHTARIFTLGDRVTVRVASVNVEDREINFLLESGNAEPELIILEE